MSGVPTEFIWDFSSKASFGLISDKPAACIKTAVTDSVELHFSVTISATARTDCIITGLLLLYKYQPPRQWLSTFCLHSHLFILPTSPPSVLTLSVVCLEIPSALPRFILEWREGMSRSLRYVNNR